VSVILVNLRRFERDVVYSAAERHAPVNTIAAGTHQHPKSIAPTAVPGAIEAATSAGQAAVDPVKSWDAEQANIPLRRPDFSAGLIPAPSEHGGRRRGTIPVLIPNPRENPTC